MQESVRDEKVVNEILEAARKLFSQYGLRKTTMDDVAKMLGKGKSTLYYYFPGKTELFEAVVKDELKKQLKGTRQAINAEPTSKGKLQAYLMTRLEIRDRLQNLGQVVYEDLFSNFGRICELKKEFEVTQVAFIREIITGGIQAGEFRQMQEEEIRFFCSWAIAAFSGLELPAGTSASLTADRQSCDRIVDFILFGIGC
jgi:AcrR family transcriptional regulator